VRPTNPSPSSLPFDAKPNGSKYCDASDSVNVATEQSGYALSNILLTMSVFCAEENELGILSNQFFISFLDIVFPSLSFNLTHWIPEMMKSALVALFATTWLFAPSPISSLNSDNVKP
jgi:hypothetical protein